jgi:hypothetical protein
VENRDRRRRTPLWKCTLVVHERGAPCAARKLQAPARRARRAGIARTMASPPTEFETELQRIPSVKCALVTDLQGVVLLRAGSSTDEAALQQMAATFALTTDQANKLRLGKAKHFTLCYGALAEIERSACARTHTASHLTPLASPVCPETMTVVHVACSPLVLTLICDRRVAVIAHLQPHPT